MIMDKTGIYQEILASEYELETLTLPISWLADASKNEVLITGIALTEGVWKNVIYSAAELKKYAPTLKGKPVLVEHGNTKEFGNKHVGVVIDSYFEPNLKGIVFKAKITDPLAKRLVKKEVLPAISASTWMDKKSINENIQIGRKYQFAELSLVRTPACNRCFIFHKEQLSALISGKDLSILKETEIDRGETEMEFGEEIETLSNIEEEEEELMDLEELEAPKLYVVLELPDEESLESLRKNKRVVSYYYGYPYYAPYYKQRFPYKYPYKYPYRGAKPLSEEQVLLAVVELDSKEELEEMRRTYRIKRFYYGRYGYPYGYGYPYKYKYKYLYPKRLGAEELSLLKRVVGEALPESVPEPVTPETPIAKTPNPESCAKVVCPIDDQEFEDEKSFLEHWNKEHKEKYGDFKETMTILAALSRIVDLTKGDTKIVKTKTGRFVVFIDTGKEGFGQWKIVGNFATRKEADEAAAKAKGKTKEEKQKEKKDEYGCIIGKEEWDEAKKKCVPISKEEQSAYTDFMKKCMADKAKEIPDVKKRMKACAAEWKSKKPEEKQQEFICPADKKKFASEKELAKHWKEKHQEKYGPLKKGYKYPEKKGKDRLGYYYFKYKGKYYPYYYRKGKYYKRYKKPKKK